jgi:hypothetical protein
MSQTLHQDFLPGRTSIARLIANAATISAPPSRVSPVSPNTFAVIAAYSTTSDATTATAIFQSSPMMKSYQKDPKDFRYFAMIPLIRAWPAGDAVRARGE